MNALDHNNVVIFDDRGLPSIMCRFARPKDAEEIPAVFKIGDKVADAALRQKIQEYQEFVDSYKDKEMPQEEMQKAQLILQTNVERSREIKEQYPLTLKPWER